MKHCTYKAKHTGNATKLGPESSTLTSAIKHFAMGHARSALDCAVFKLDRSVITPACTASASAITLQMQYNTHMHWTASAITLDCKYNIKLSCSGMQIQ